MRTPHWLALVAILGAAACSGSSDDEPIGCALDGRDLSYDPRIDPADFVSAIDHKFFPLVPGTSFRHQTARETVDVTVTTDTKAILGVTCVVVRDTVTLRADGKVFEDTYDWYAQDKAGNVWYMGEATKEFPPGGEVSTAGSWEAGVDCAKPGIAMKAAPLVGDSYRQEYYPGEAEDRAEVLALGEKVTVPAGTFEGCVRTKDTSDLSPGTVEHKTYCPGVGVVLVEEIVAVGMGEREELVSMEKK